MSAKPQQSDTRSLPVLEWGDEHGSRHQAFVRSADELTHLLGKLETESVTLPAIATLINPNDDCLSIGIGAEFSFLSFVRGNDEPPYLVTCGAVTDLPIAFHFGMEINEIQPYELVVKDDAIRGLRYFFETGELLNSLDWREV